MTRKDPPRCQEVIDGVRCGKTRPAYLCTAKGVHRLCAAHRHEEGCCKLVAEVMEVVV